MSLTFQNVKIDESDSRFRKLKETFTEEIKKRFSCDDYDPIVNFVFNFVFESKNTKEDSIKEMRELFYDKSEEILELLWELTDKIYGNNTTNIPQISNSSNDVLDEIYKDKNENQKRFPSQIVNPNVDQNKSNINKPLFNSAIERVKDDSRRKERYDRNEYERNDYERSDRNRYRERPYEPRRYDERSDDRRDSRRRRDDTARTMQVGDKKIVLKRKERSRSNSLERDRVREEKPYEEENYDRNYPREQQPYDTRNFYPNERAYFPKERGFYPVRRFGRGAGRFGRFMAVPRFYGDPRDPRNDPRNDPRRPMIRNRLVARPQTELTDQPQQEQINTNATNNIQEHVEAPRMEVDNNQLDTSMHQAPYVPYVPNVHHEGEKTAEAKKKMRCKKWPMCKSETCEFSHPKETCPYFPKCMFGEKCLFIHPSITCKFGFYCTRLGCAYSHPVGYNPGARMMPQMQMGWGGPNKFKNFKFDNRNKSHPTQNVEQLENIEQVETQNVPQQNMPQNIIENNPEQNQ